MNIYKQIFKQIKKYDTIVIARHIGADPDALGSQFALKNIILELFPDKKVLLPKEHSTVLKYNNWIL